MLMRDYPEYPEQECTCCYCEQRFIENHPLWKRTWEHLDNDKTNQELWNLAWAHFFCNNKKKNDPDLQIIAFELIQKNKKWQSTFDFESAREREKLAEPAEHTEIDLNTAHVQITTEFFAEKITGLNPSYPLGDAVYCIVLRCREETGHGSAQAVRNYINELCCSEGKYKIEGKKGKSYITKRLVDK